jgi:membrane protease YdiL (CAAX protease family)
MVANRRLFFYAVVVLGLNVIAAVVAVVVNWPSQFGAVRTDAGDDPVTAGTAISAPLLPVVLLIVIIAFARRQNALGWIAIVAAFLTAVMFFIGAMGELFAQPTAETPKAVLTTAGLVWAVVAIVLAVLAALAAMERLRSKRSPA